jgi:hypothetical protein
MESCYDPFRIQKLLNTADEANMGSLIENIEDEGFKSSSII